jgi:hypothetical protein
MEEPALEHVETVVEIAVSSRRTLIPGKYEDSVPQATRL